PAPARGTLASPAGRGNRRAPNGNPGRQRRRGCRGGRDGEVMRVLIVCGAGASSTFLAQRLRRAAIARGVDLTPVPTSSAAAPELVPASDVVIAGAHLGAAIAALGSAAAAADVPFVVIADAAREDGDTLLDTTLAAFAVDHGRTP